jgi:hypothetical protein
LKGMLVHTLNLILDLKGIIFHKINMWEDGVSREVGHGQQHWVSWHLAIKLCLTNASSLGCK